MEQNQNFSNQSIHKTAFYSLLLFQILSNKLVSKSDYKKLSYITVPLNHSMPSFYVLTSCIMTSSHLSFAQASTYSIVSFTPVCKARPILTEPDYL